jgi:hypothetical protein
VMSGCRVTLLSVTERSECCGAVMASVECLGGVFVWQSGGLLQQWLWFAVPFEKNAVTAMSLI